MKIFGRKRRWEEQELFNKHISALLADLMVNRQYEIREQINDVIRRIESIENEICILKQGAKIAMDTTRYK